MFNTIIAHLANEGILGNSTLKWVNKICDFWESISPETKNKLVLIKEKYQFENLIKLRRPDSRETHLMFWKSMAEFALTPAIEDHDIDSNFIKFIPDIYEHVEMGDFDIYSLSGEEEDCYWKNIDRLFYTWISYLWQEIEGKTCGIPVCTFDSSRMFYFNDFLYDDYSSYHQERSGQRIQGSKFNRDLQLEEIFVRTNRDYRFVDKEFSIYFEKGTENLVLNRSANTTSLFSTLKGKLQDIKHASDQSWDNSPDLALKYFFKQADKLINDDWRIVLNF